MTTVHFHCIRPIYASPPSTWGKIQPSGWTSKMVHALNTGPVHTIQLPRNSKLMYGLSMQSGLHFKSGCGYGVFTHHLSPRHAIGCHMEHYVCIGLLQDGDHATQVPDVTLTRAAEGQRSNIRSVTLHTWTFWTPLCLSPSRKCTSTAVTTYPLSRSAVHSLPPTKPPPPVTKALGMLSCK